MKNNVHTYRNACSEKEPQRKAPLFFLKLFTGLILLLAYSHAQAQGCAGNAEYSLFGSAKLDAASGDIMLTANSANQSGQAWSKRVVDLRQSYYQRFYVYLGANDAGADGFAFVLRGMTNQRTGVSGGGLGYQGITPSLAVEFDTWSNSNYGDIVNDHIALHRNGDPTATGRIGSNVDLGNMEDGQFHLVYFNWDAIAQLLTVEIDGVEKLRVTRDIINLDFGGNPNVVPGFTASTGPTNFNEQRVCIEELLYTQYYCPGNEEFLLTGNATLQNEGIVLTPNLANQAGQAWSRKTIDLTRDFTQMFDINLGSSDAGGDGFAFLLRGNTTQVSGATGAGLGYHGITPSLAFEFDTYSNTDRGDIANDHFALHRGGNSYATGRIGSNVDLGNLENSKTRSVIIDWTASTQTITVIIDDVVIYTTVRDIVALDFAGNPYVTIGFTASTGAAFNLQTVCIGNLMYTPLEIKASAISATCAGATANSNGKLILDNYGNVSKVGYSIGNTYTGPDFSTATTITAAPYTVVSNLPNPTVNQPYTIRMFSTASIYTDKTVTLSPVTCATADLSLTVATAVQTGNKGEILTYTFTATNNGPSDVTDAVADIDIPSNVTLLNALPSQGTYTASTKQWNIGAIANGGSKTLKIDVRVN